MRHKASGKSVRKGITLIELMNMFPDEESAVKWFESVRWPTPDDRYCPKCGSTNSIEKPNRKPLPFRCRYCRAFFSVRHGSVMERSHIPLQKWAIAIYLNATSLKGVSSMKLHRDIGITQKTAWHMAHRLKEAFASDPGLFIGPIEVDETYIGGKEKNKHSHKKLRAGRGAVGKIAIVGAKDRATNKITARTITDTTGKTLKGFVCDNATTDALIYTDEHRAYCGLKNHATVCHSVGEYVNGQAHTNGIESFWAVLKRGYHGTFHHFSENHTQRYVNEFAGRHNIRKQDTIKQMLSIVAGMVGKRLCYADLIGRTQ